jgi:hypothetical protein
MTKPGIAHPIRWLIGLLFALGAPVFAADTTAREPLRDLAAFEHWVADNLHCRGDFMGDVQDQKFLDRVRALGVTVKTDWVEGDTPDGDFMLPRPILIGGHAATKIHYWGDSGAEFYAIVTAPADALAKELHTKPVPQRLKHDFDAQTVGVTFVGSAKGGERLAPAVFVRHSDAAGASEVGCRYFDG